MSDVAISLITSRVFNKIPHCSSPEWDIPSCASVGMGHENVVLLLTRCTTKWAVTPVGHFRKFRLLKHNATASVCCLSIKGFVWGFCSIPVSPLWWVSALYSFLSFLEIIINGSWVFPVQPEACVYNNVSGIKDALIYRQRNQRCQIRSAMSLSFFKRFIFYFYLFIFWPGLELKKKKKEYCSR